MSKFSRFVMPNDMSIPIGLRSSRRKAEQLGAYESPQSRTNMGTTIAYMFQLHCYDLCFLHGTHPGHRMYAWPCSSSPRSGCDRCDTGGFGRRIVIDQSNRVDYNRGY